MDYFRAIANGCAIDYSRQGEMRRRANSEGSFAESRSRKDAQAVAQFCLRLTAMGENTLAFTGTAFESDAATRLV